MESRHKNEFEGLGDTGTFELLRRQFSETSKIQFVSDILPGLGMQPTTHARVSLPVLIT